VDRVTFAGGGLMLQGNDVPRMMSRVQATLQRAERSATTGEPSVYVVSPVGDSDLATARLRHLADIQIDFHSGSDRPVIGPTIRLAKRAVRRGLRWYLGPIAAQQTRFNHAAVEVLEKLRLQNEAMSAEVERLQSER
jgi:hypothetical protein